MADDRLYTFINVFSATVGLCVPLNSFQPEDGFASAPSSDDESERKDKKTKKKLSGFSSLIRKFRLSKKEDQHDENSRPKRPSSLAIPSVKKPTDATRASPHSSHSPSSHPPQFYEEVAETLDKIAQKYIVTKPAWPSPDSQPTITAESENYYCDFNAVAAVRCSPTSILPMVLVGLFSWV